MRIKKTRKVKTPSGEYTYYETKKKTKASCGVTGESLMGKRRNRPHPDVTSKVSRELIKAKVRNYVKKE